VRWLLRRLLLEEEPIKNRFSRREAMKHSNLQLFAVAAAAAVLCVVPQAAQAQTGFSNSLGDHLFYVGTDSQVHESFISQGVDLNLSLLSKNTTPALVTPTGVPIASFTDSSGEYVYYLDDEQNVVRLFNPATETVSQYTQGDGWVNSVLVPTVGSSYFALSVTGWHDSNGETIFYTANPTLDDTSSSSELGHLFCPAGGECNLGASLEETGSSWTGVTTVLGAEPANGSNLASFVDSVGEHLFYFDSNQHVAELWRQAGTDNWFWLEPNLAGHTPLPHSGLTAFSDGMGEHVFFEDTNQHINQLYLPNSGSWSDQDLSQATNANPAADFSEMLPSPLTSFADGYGEHIFYVDTSDRVDQLYWDNGPWVFQSGQSQLGSLTVDHCSGLGGWSDKNNIEWVGYISGGQVSALQFWGSWSTINLTRDDGGPGATYPCAD
jgi:hypothetical protein